VSVDEQRFLVLQQRAVEAMRERIVCDSYMKVVEVAARLAVSRATVEGFPMAVLPYADLGTRTKACRRYHPADVQALDARLRAWRGAEDSEAHLAGLREELDQRDRLAVAFARAAEIE